jgi:phosphatidylserine/phosphatidylglycerophosphate/cardiolipin synthase-like enzyme
VPSDADIVRCTSPWPGTAAQLLEGLAALGTGSWSAGRICSASGTTLAPGDAVQILSGLEITGICIRSDDGGTWRTELNTAELQRLATLLRGAEQYRRLKHEAQQLELVVTMPMAPSFLAHELPEAPGRPGGYLSTSEALLRIAQSARSRLVAMTPFIDGYGFGWLRTVFEATPFQAQKILILREAGRYAVDLSVHHSEWLRAHNVSVRDYHLPHPAGTQRALPLETFHAKIVLADERLAYVGSANLLGSGDGTSLEAGVLVDGGAAAQVARLVDGVLRVARRI